MTTIALATTDDISALCQLLAVLFAQESEFTPNHEAQCRGLSQVIENNTIGHIFVARQQNKIVGMLSLLYTVSTALGGKVALLEDMIVLPSYRNTGIGSLLLEHAIAFAQHNGCQRLTLLTDCANESAKRFYQRHGFISSSMIPLRLSLLENA